MNIPSTMTAIQYLIIIMAISVISVPCEILKIPLINIDISIYFNIWNLISVSRKIVSIFLTCQCTLIKWLPVSDSLNPIWPLVSTFISPKITTHHILRNRNSTIRGWLNSIFFFLFHWQVSRRKTKIRSKNKYIDISLHFELIRYLKKNRYYW